LINVVKTLPDFHFADRTSMLGEHDEVMDSEFVIFFVLTFQLIVTYKVRTMSAPSLVLLST